jgi:hypothetical protein
MTFQDDDVAAAAVREVNDGPAARYVPQPAAVVVLRERDMACVLVRSTETSARVG